MRQLPTSCVDSFRLAITFALSAYNAAVDTTDTAGLFCFCVPQSFFYLVRNVEGKEVLSNLLHGWQPQMCGRKQLQSSLLARNKNANLMQAVREMIVSSI